MAAMRLVATCLCVSVYLPVYSNLKERILNHALNTSLGLGSRNISGVQSYFKGYLNFVNNPSIYYWLNVCLCSKSSKFNFVKF